MSLTKHSRCVYGDAPQRKNAPAFPANNTITLRSCELLTSVGHIHIPEAVDCDAHRPENLPQTGATRQTACTGFARQRCHNASSEILIVRLLEWP
jgi:hypothetical protein